MPHHADGSPTPADRPSSGFGRRPGVPLALAAIAALFVAVLVVSAFPVSASALARTGAHTSVGSAAPAGATTRCNSYSSTTPSAVLIPLANPSSNLSAKGTLTVNYEIQVLNFTNATVGTTIYVPNLWFKFPETNGATYEIHENATVLTVASGGWESPPNSEKNVTVAGGLDFAQNQKASLTSQKLAVMADAWYGNLTIQIRWHWQNTVGIGRPTGPWSLLTTTTSSPSKSLPSVFEPAPYVYILNFNGSAVIGSNYSDTLGGFVAGQRFFLEMEYPTSGKVVQDLPTVAPANATTVNVSIPVLNYVSSLSPGTYLVHIHDTCGALLWNKSVKAVYPPNATITFYFQPATCGPITFNGSTFHNGSSVTVAPSTVAYSFSLPVCKGHSFHNWSTTGGLHIETSKQLLVSASGTFTIEYN